MQKALLYFLSAAAIITLSFTGAGSEFEGKITFEISVTGGNMPPEALAMFAGSEINVFIKGIHSRADVNMGMQNSSTITDRKANTTVMLTEMMGHKYKIIDNTKKDEKEPEAVIKYLDETKEIAGYKCKKAEITFKDKTGETHTTSVFYTEEISNHMGNDTRSSHFKKLKGMPLEYEMEAERGMKMKMTVKKVSKESVPDSKFDIPADYKETTREGLQKEMMQMYQGGGQH